MQEREREKVLHKQRVDALKEKRKLEKAELVKFVSRQKAQEEAQVEKVRSRVQAQGAGWKRSWSRALRRLLAAGRS